MHPSQNSGEVVLQLGRDGLSFAVAPERSLTFAKTKVQNEAPLVEADSISGLRCGAESRTEDHAHKPYPTKDSAVFWCVDKTWTRFVASLFVSIAFWSLPMFTRAASNTGADLVARTNKIRAEHGLASLTNNPVLAQAALAKANDMFARQYFSHTSPIGQTPWSFFTSTGYRFTSAAENLALEPNNAVDPTAAWMASSTHRQNILDPKFRDIGMAVVSGTYEGKPTTFIVQLVGSRTSATSVATTTVPTTPLKPATVLTSPAVDPVIVIPPPAPPTSNQMSETGDTPIPTISKPAHVLGVTTQVIHTPESSREVINPMNETISALVVQVIGIYIFLITSIGLCFFLPVDRRFAFSRAIPIAIS